MLQKMCLNFKGRHICRLSMDRTSKYFHCFSSAVTCRLRWFKDQLCSRRKIEYINYHQQSLVRLLDLDLNWVETEESKSEVSKGEKGG